MGIYKKEDSKFWYADIRIPGLPRLRATTGETDRRKAQIFHDNEVRRILSQTSGAVRMTLLSNYVLKWCQVSYRGLPDIQSISKFMTFYADRPIQEAAEDRDGIDEALRQFVKKPGTYTRYRARLMGIFNMAVDDGVLPAAPQLRVWENTTPPNQRFVEKAELPGLLRELPPHQRPMVMFAVHTGLRQSNVLQLRWSQVDMDRRIVSITAKHMKNSRSIAVPLNDTAHSVLASVADEHAEFVFTYKGRPIVEIKTAFLKACARAGFGTLSVYVDPETGKKRQSYTGLRWHDLRHTFASWHAMSGTPPQVIKELGGWRSMAMVERYMHLSAPFTASFANNIK